MFSGAGRSRTKNKHPPPKDKKKFPIKALKKTPPSLHSPKKNPLGSFEKKKKSLELGSCWREKKTLEPKKKKRKTLLPKPQVFAPLPESQLIHQNLNSKAQQKDLYFF